MVLQNTPASRVLSGMACPGLTENKLAAVPMVPSKRWEHLGLNWWETHQNEDLNLNLLAISASRSGDGMEKNHEIPMWDWSTKRWSYVSCVSTRHVISYVSAVYILYIYIYIYIYTCIHVHISYTTVYSACISYVITIYHNIS